MLLVNIGYLYCVTDFYGSCIRFLDSHDQAEKGGLASSVRAYDADYSGRREDEIQVLEQKFVSVCLAHIVELDYLVSKMRAVWYVDLQVGFFLLDICGCQFLVGSKTCFLLGLSCFRSHSHPFKLSLEGLSSLAFGLFFHLQALCLLVQPGRVVAFPRDAFSAIQLQDPPCNVVQEVTVVCYGNYGSLVLPQVGFQPQDTLSVKMVGRFVQQQNIRLAEQQAAQCNPSSFTSG